MNKQWGILLYDDVQPMDVIGPWETFSFWKTVLHAPITMQLISEKGGMVQCDNGIVMQAHCDFNQAPLLDYFIVPGGRGRKTEIDNPALIAFIQKQAQHCDYLLSVCTGMFLLHKAGVLSGKSATTYWRALPQAKQFNDIQIVENRIVKDGKIWLSGGVTSGIDLSLALIADVAGQEVAGQVQLLLEYFPSSKPYSTLDMAYTLPLYNNEESEIYLPEYMRKILDKK